MKSIKPPIIKEGTRATSSESKRKHYRKESDNYWAPKGKPITIAGITITNGMLYIKNSRTVPEPNSYGVINPLLEVAKSIDKAAYKSMSYWKTYNNIQPENRRIYLEWLKGGAIEPDIHVGYVIMYFYGLERRLFSDQSIDDATYIIAEIKRLLLVYGDNSVVQSYFNEALTFSNLLLNKGHTFSAPVIQQGHRYILLLDINIYIGNKLKSGFSLTSYDLLLLFLNHPKVWLSTPALRLEQEFLALMELRLNEKYPEGLKVAIPEEKIIPSDYASHSSFIIYFLNSIKGIPDISGDKSTLSKIQKIYSGVIDDLNKLSRFLGQNPDAAGTLKASALLPNELIYEFGGDSIQSLQTWLREQESLSGVVTIASLINKTTEQDDTKITKTIYKEAYNLLTALGWNLFPALNEIDVTVKPNLKVLFLPVDEGGLAVTPPSSEFIFALFELVLGAYIAHADSCVLELQLKYLSNRINSLNHLNQNEIDRLQNYLKWLTIQDVGFSAIKRKLKITDSQAKDTLKNIALEVATADGTIVPKEVQALEKIYEAMGLDKQGLFSALHSFTGTGGKLQKYQTLNSQLSENPKNKLGNKDIVLDMDLIASTQHDTEKASALLANIFKDDTEEIKQEIKFTDNPIENFTKSYEGLDDVHIKLLEKLLEKDEWPRREYELLAESLKLMPDGALETINEWAFVVYEDTLIEDDDPLVVYKDLLCDGS